MCGINGFNFSDENLIRKMNAKVKHRGPDSEGTFVCENVSLGHTRLAIIDLSAKAAQPMFSADNSLVLVFNGEIYNFQDIKKELEAKGYKFVSNSDSEVIICAYQEYGIDCLKKFNGIFAFAIFDKKNKSLFLARDRMGVKPLYYWQDPSAGSGQVKFIFSSEIKAILEHKIKREIDMDALNIYFRTLYVPAPLTMFKGIKKLEPANYLVLKDNKLEKKKYWQPTDFENIGSKEEAIKQIQDLLKDSVRLQLISDRPVGVFLSGGIDSTVITGIVSEQTHSTGSGQGKIKTFSANYDIKADKFDVDANLARKTSEYYKTDHTEIEISGLDARDNIFDVIYGMDEPVANATQIATYILSKHASEKVKVVLGGDGGDELFGGYERYRLSKLISDYQKIPLVLRKTFGNAFINLIKNKYPHADKMNLIPGAKRYLSFMAQKEKDVGNILKKEINNQNITEKFYRENFFAEVLPDFEKSFMLADLRSWLPDESLVRSDKMSMAYGLEQRVPILDHRLVELSLKIPTKWKIEGKNTKEIFKVAMKDYIPDYIMNQPKRGWFSPASTWLRQELKETVYETLSENYNSEMKNIFDFNKIRIMLDNHIEGKVYNMNLLWAIMTWQIWYRKFF